MLRVLVVDDEEIIRKGIIRKVERLIDNAEIVGEAADGEQALIQVEQKKPDIVLTDIKMPIIDGLMFIEKALELSEDTKFIIFSGYNDFEYAQKALRLGVCDYLLKPINNEDLVRVIREAENRIASEQQQRKYFSKLVNNTEKDQIVLKNNIFSELIESGELGTTAAKMDEAGYRFTLPHFTAFSIRIASREGCVFSDTNVALLKFAVCNICEEILTAAGAAVVIDNRRDEEFVYGFINHKADVHKLRHLFESAVGNTAELLGVKIFFGVGQQYESIGHVGKSYTESKKAVRQKHIFADSDVIFHEDYVSLKGNFYVLTEETRNLIHGLLNDVNEEGLIELIDRLLGELIQKKVEYSKVVEICIEILLIMINFLKQENSYSNTDLHDISVHSYFDACIRKLDFQKLLTKRIKSCCAFKRDKNMSGGKKIVQQILERIEKEYFNDLKLSTFAKQYFLNQSYLSQLFATETGENFSTYISILRIKKAKDLLKSTNFSTSKVGELVGYKERSYFTKVFEKYEKVTPYKYRENMKK